MVAAFTMGALSQAPRQGGDPVQHPSACAGMGALSQAPRQGGDPVRHPSACAHHASEPSLRARCKLVVLLLGLLLPIMVVVVVVVGSPVPGGEGSVPPAQTGTTLAS